MEEEEYVGGLESGRLKKGWAAGYGVNVTNRRIIGAKSRKALGKALASAMLGGVAGAYVGMKLSRDENAKMIQELEAKKDFEISKTNVSRIELKKPTFVSRGHIIIASTTGEQTNIIIADKKDYERLLTLMKAFYPEVVTVF